MHGSDVQKSDVAIHTRLRVDIPAFTDFLSPIDGLAILEGVSGEDRPLLFVKGRIPVKVLRPHCERQVGVRIKYLADIPHVPVVEHVLRLTVAAEDDPGSQGVGGVVHRHPSHVRQDLTSDKVSLPGIEHGLGGDDIIVAVFGDLHPHVFRHGLIPGKAQFLMVNTELDLPLFQRLLLGAEVVHVCIRNVVGLTKEAVVAPSFLFTADDALREIIELLVGVAHQTGVEDMVVVPAAVEANQVELHQILNLLGGGVDHPHHRSPRALELPVYQEEVGEDLHVIEHQLGLVVLCRRSLVLRLELHPVDQLDAVVGLIAAVGRKSQNSVSHVRHVVDEAAVVAVFQNLIDKVDAGLSIRMDLLIEVLPDLSSKPLLAFDYVIVYHFTFSFQR